jgi:hypothetical protein
LIILNDQFLIFNGNAAVSYRCIFIKKLFRYYNTGDISDAKGIERSVELVGGSKPSTATRESPVRGALATLIRPDHLDNF